MPIIRARVTGGGVLPSRRVVRPPERYPGFRPLRGPGYQADGGSPPERVSDSTHAPIRQPSTIALLPLSWLTYTVFPFLGDQRRFLVVLTLSRELLDMGMGLVGRVRVEGLDRVWWKLRRLRDKSHVRADTIEGDSDSDEIVEIWGGGLG